MPPFPLLAQTSTPAEDLLMVLVAAAGAQMTREMRKSCERA